MAPCCPGASQEGDADSPDSFPNDWEQQQWVMVIPEGRVPRAVSAQRGVGWIASQKKKKKALCPHTQHWRESLLWKFIAAWKGMTERQKKKKSLKIRITNGVFKGQLFPTLPLHSLRAACKHSCVGRGI